MGIETLGLSDSRTIQTKDNLNIFMKTDPVIILETDKTDTTKQVTKPFSITASKKTQILNAQIQKNRSSTLKHQRQIDLAPSIDETSSDPRDIDNTETSDLQLNHIHCETTDDESYKENTLLNNMLKI